MPISPTEAHPQDAILRFPSTRSGLRWLLSLAYLSVGLVHLARPEIMLPIVPDWVPFPREVLIGTGLCEIAAAIGLHVPGLRRPVAVMLAIYAVCVFPANVKHAVEGVALPFIPDSWWYHGPRLAFQPVLVWAPLFATGLLDWPFGPGADNARQDAE